MYDQTDESLCCKQSTILENEQALKTLDKSKKTLIVVF